jgi:1,4-alpha-glucan branching enzyme
VKPESDGGAGFDATQHDGLRNAIRAALRQASGGGGATVSMDAIAASLWPAGFPRDWQAVTCVENHDLVYWTREDRLPRLADGGNPRSWYARSRSRVASALLLTAPGIPMLFMGQEFLEDKRWSDSRLPEYLLWWGGLEGGDKAVQDHLRFMQEIIRTRHRFPALRRGRVNPFHVHNDNRVLAFHRWIEGEGRDVVVVASLNDCTFYNYAIGFPCEGRWTEVFNSDVYDNYVNPWGSGNGGGIWASAAPTHGLPCSASIVIPANAVLVFARDGAGDN